MSDLFVNLEIITFGEIRLILTFKALIFFLTPSSLVMLLKSNQSSELVTTELALNLAILQTSPSRLVSNKVILCCKRLITWLVTQKGFAVIVYSFEVHWQLVLLFNILTTLGTIDL